MTEDKQKKGKIQPFEVCEYIKECDREDCPGKLEDRVNTFSCGLRRWMLTKAGYKVDYS